jgi:hypothetical protein
MFSGFIPIWGFIAMSFVGWIGICELINLGELELKTLIQGIDSGHRKEQHQ